MTEFSHESTKSQREREITKSESRKNENCNLLQMSMIQSYDGQLDVESC
jgi:hypothetical protein